MADSKSSILGKCLPALKSSFRAAFFRTCWYSDNHDELDRIYRNLKDPWNFETSAYEKERFAVLLDEVKRHPHGSILEVGCAEGMFTSMLTTLTHDIVAIDVSPTAIARARERHTAPRFIATSLDGFEPARKYDLVVCAETLYYIRDVAGAVEKLSAIGKRCVVSYLGRESKRLDPYLRDLRSVEFREIRVGSGISGGTMIVAAWENQEGGVPEEACRSGRGAATNETSPETIPGPERTPQSGYVGARNRT